MKSRNNGVLAAAALSITVVAACSSPSEGAAPSGSSSSGSNTLKVGVVPGPDIGLLSVPEVQKMFADKGVTLEVSSVQGPQVVTGVVSGQFDIAYAAYAPPILAMAAGTDLRLVSGLSAFGPEGHNGATLVKKGSGINTWEDIAGRKVATPSPKSLSALTLQAAIGKAGGDDTKKLQIVPLPQAQVAKALDAGDADVADLVEPFASEALSTYPDLQDIGDSKAYVLGSGGPFTGFFTTAKVSQSKAGPIAAFKAALEEAIAFGNANPDLVKKAGAKQAGLTEEVALTLPDSSYKSAVTVSGLQPLVDAMVAQSWVPKAPDLAKFVG